MKKLAAFMAAMTVLSGSLQLGYAQDSEITQSIAANRSNFASKMQLSSSFLNLLKAHPGDSAKLETEKFAFTIFSDEIGEIPPSVRSYDLRTRRLTENLDRYDKAVGFKTPKYVIEIKEEQNFPCPIHFTIKQSNFMPGSIVHVYAYTGTYETDETTTNTFEQVKLDIRVQENGDLTFPITKGGTYLISPQKVEEHSDYLEAAVYTYDMPERNQIEDLLSYLKEDPDGYFTQLWEAPPKSPAEDYFSEELDGKH